MTPEILTLSRTICGMEGAPCCHGGFSVRRDTRGMLWLSDKDDKESIGWVLDLTDAATGGALLSYIGPGWIIYQRHHDGAWEISRTNGADRQEGETLGIAVAKVIAVRGWKP